MQQDKTVIELTKTDIIRAIHKGSAEHTDLAAKYIARIKADIGLDAVAVYGTNCTQMMLDEPTTEQKRGLFNKKYLFRSITLKKGSS